MVERRPLSTEASELVPLMVLGMIFLGAGIPGITYVIGQFEGVDFPWQVLTILGIDGVVLGFAAGGAIGNHIRAHDD